MNILKKITITTLCAIFFLIPFSAFSQTTKYSPLANYDGYLDPSITSGNGGFSNYLNTVMGIMIALAAVAAVVMIVVGGLQYMTTDAVNNKADGKKKITSAIGGLILALSSWLILNTINPNILKFEFGVDNVAKENEEYRKFAIKLGEVLEETGEVFNAYPGTPGAPLSGEAERARAAVLQAELASGDVESDASRRLLNSALYYAENRISTAGESGGGNLACGDAACAMINAAYGEGTVPKLSYTPDLKNWMNESPKFTLVGNGLEYAKPGYIIISPTDGPVTGHVGVIKEVGGEGGGRIISNSSTQKVIFDNYSFKSWSDRFKESKHLPLYIYRPN